MARYRGPVCRLCRRESTKLYLKGERCYTDKCSIERKNYQPGMHRVDGKKRTKMSEFGTQLREKQKVKRVYGMMEGQFRTFFEKAANKKGVVAENFFRSLELRVDNVVYRMGFARSRNEARQLVRHNHLLVNGKRLNIPSAQLSPGDVLTIQEKSRSNPFFELSKQTFSKRTPLAWVDVDHANFTGKVVSNPTREDVQMPVKDRLIVELYSK